MGSNQEGAARPAREGVGVSSGDSSAPMPRPALDADAATVPGVSIPSLSGSSAEGSDAETVIAPVPRIKAPSPEPLSASHPIFASIGATIFHEGDVLGGRYEIQKLLGMGGMGAVYKARDMEVERVVALKVIRPDLAGNPAILARFKQELVLARQVTHRNIIRIYDLNEAQGVKFITMEYIEGEDLRSILAGKGKLSPQEAVPIILQVCTGLQAAHTEGVIHRDLKPGNIMRDAGGRVVIMDFGLARSLESDGMTQTGMMVGTMEYMSPEQAMGKELDARSDEFAIGLILYELLTGFMPYQAESAIASLVKRTQERVRPLVDVDASTPAELSDIVSRMLERDPQQRFASMEDVAEALEIWQGKRPRTGQSTYSRVAPPQVVPAPAPKRLPVKWIGIGLAAVALAVGGVVGTNHWKSSTPAGTTRQGPTTSLAIVPFRNASGDASLDWVGTYLAETLVTDVGQSSSLRSVSTDRIHQLLHDLQLTPSSSLDAGTLRRLGTSSDASIVVWGQYSKFGDQIRIEASVQDLKRDRTTSLKFEAPNQNALPATVDQLAQAIRENLALSPSVLKELQAQAFQPSSKSLPALRGYNLGMELARRWDYLEARKHFQDATSADPEFALAYARLAQADSVLGNDAEAEASSRKAVALSQSLPFPEKFRIEAIHSWTMRDYPKAIEKFESLAKASPDDADVRSALGELYLNTGAYDKARELYSKSLAQDDKSAEALFGMGRVDLQSGNPQRALDSLNRALSFSIQAENDEEKALILHAIGFGYRLLNKPDEALRNFQESLVINRRLNEKAAVARSLNAIGQVMSRLGKTDDALKNYREALALRREIGDKRGIADTLIDVGNLYNDRGQYPQAMENYKESLQLERDLGNEHSQSLALNNVGSVYFAEGDYQAALTFYQQALQLREKLKVPGDIAESVHNLGDTALRMGQFDQALTYYLRALDLYRSIDDKRDAAIESHSTADVFKYQGRYGAALKAEEDALNVFRQLQDRGSWFGDILSGYGSALILAGRGEEAQATLQEAQTVASEIKSDPLMAQVLNFQGDRAFYAGDLKSAKAQYEEALRIVSRTNDREKILVAKLNLAKVAVAAGNSREAIKTLKTLAGQADALGLKYLSLECSVYLGQAQTDAKDYASAKQELRSALDKSDKLGARLLLAKSNYLLANALRLSGEASEAAGHYREAAHLLDALRNEQGAEKIMQRVDLKTIYDDSSRWSQTAKS